MLLKWFLQRSRLDSYDRKAQKAILRSIELYHTGNKWNMYRAIRMYNHIRKVYGCCFPPTITVGKNLYIAHAHGILIGKTAQIGDNCCIYPNALIVAKVEGDAERRRMGERRWHPKIGNNCMIGAGSLIVGPIEIGDNVTVAAGAIVTKDVPSNTLVINCNEIRYK